MGLFDPFNHKARFQAIRSSHAMIEFDPDGRVLDANAPFLALFGYQLEEIKGQLHRIFVPNEDVESDAYAVFWANLRAGRFQKDIFRRLDKAGNEIWISGAYSPVISSGGKVTSVIKIASDVTAVMLEHADFLGLIEAINRSSVVVAFDMQGTILTANDRFLEATGYGLDDVVGKSHAMLLSAEERDSEEAARFWAALRSGEFQTGVMRRIGQQGQDVWLQSTYTPIKDSSGRYFKVVNFATDITEIILQRQRRMQAQENITRELKHISQLVFATSNEAMTGSVESADASASMETIATGSEKLAGSVAEIGRQVASALSMTTDAVKQSESTNNVVLGLSSAAQRIGKVVDLISTIAQQTNLLALNATIEAARAGTMGKGFAVVAAEVKQLADQTAKATADISAQISSVQATTIEAVGAIDSIKTTINQINDISAKIAAAVDEQMAVTTEMSGNMRVAARGVETLNAGMEEISKSTQQLDDATNRVWEASRALFQ